jgi:hypothetical protein
VVSPREGFEQYLRTARADPAVLGVVLTASQAMGLGTEDSDYDARTILRDDAAEEDLARYGETSFPGVDAGGGTLADFMRWAEWGTEFAWDRYAFAHAQVLHDPTGVIAPLVTAKGRIPPDHRQSFTRGTLDAFINSAYRALKCARKRNAVCARIEATEAVQYGLTVLFALEGRVRPYPTYLDYELRQHPLETLPMTGGELLEFIEAIVLRGEIAALQRVFVIVLELARGDGHGDVIDGWGDRIEWMATWSPAVPACPTPAIDD